MHPIQQYGMYAWGKGVHEFTGAGTKGFIYHMVRGTRCTSTNKPPGTVLLHGTRYTAAVELVMGIGRNMVVRDERYTRREISRGRGSMYQGIVLPWTTTGNRRGSAKTKELY